VDADFHTGHSMQLLPGHSIHAVKHGTTPCPSEGILRDGGRQDEQEEGGGGNSGWIGQLRSHATVSFCVDD
jgi:hypothetical protein